MDDNNLPKNNKKGLLTSIIIILVVALGAAGYYFVIKKAAKPIVWDGSYKMVGDLPCTGNFPNLTAVPMNSIFTVSSNKIQEPSLGQSFDIDKKGKATEAAQQTQNGITSDIKADYQFYQEKGVNKFTATGTLIVSTAKDGKTYSSTCTGTITGDKQ